MIYSKRLPDIPSGNVPPGLITTVCSSNYYAINRPRY